ncbi:MAG: hypothetical protein H6729_04210 [Deltaproteobacteria bacterium]|nr:hypothetical protein [Deltaproteobacteria bacterium]
MMSSLRRASGDASVGVAARVDPLIDAFARFAPADATREDWVCFPNLDFDAEAKPGSTAGCGRRFA